MEIVSARSALLSNYEVFKLLGDQQAHFLATATTEASHASSSKIADVEIPAPNRDLTQAVATENLVRIQKETLAYLATELHPTLRQDEALVKNLLQQLRHYPLTKVEKLMISNLAPVSNVELYAIVEEFEDRLADQGEQIIDIVTSCLHAHPVEQTLPRVLTADNDFDAHGEEYVDDWIGEEQVYLDEDRYGGGADDLADEGMEED